MTIYEVWDFDPWDGSMGADYIADRFRKQADAEALVERLNKASFERYKQNGRRVRGDETWMWERSRVKAVKVK